VGVWDPHEINVVAKLLNRRSTEHVVSNVDITIESFLL
jgi:hypothetical protein